MMETAGLVLSAIGETIDPVGLLIVLLGGEEATKGQATL